MDIVNHVGTKYKLEILDITSEEYKVVKKFYEITYYYVQRVFEFQIFKVIENDPMKAAVDGKRHNLMLFHGTSRCGVEGILNEGFEHTKEGWFGSGVYMSECSSTAFGYTHKRNDYSKKGKINFMFVNEV